MNQSFTLFRVAGIRVGVNWSWVIAFALIGWTLGAGAFPAQVPHRSSTAYAAMAVVATLLFFGSILLHELGHALQARRDGVEIEGITLWLFGGVASFRGGMPSAAAELRIALAGPAVTLVLAGVFVGGGVGLGWRDAVGGVAAWLGYINAVLLVFNLVPAFPLDGGRVLRALLWRRSGDYASATRHAGKVGRVLAYCLMAAGVVVAVAVDAVSGLWLIVLGWFIANAAAAESQQSLLETALHGLRVGDVMVRQPVTAEAEWTLEEFVRDVGSRHSYMTYPVVDDGRVVGLLPLTAVAGTPEASWRQTRVRDLTIPLARVPSVREDEALVEALGALHPARLGRALVRRGNLVVGLLSISDVRRLLAPRPR